MDLKIKIYSSGSRMSLSSEVNLGAWSDVFLLQYNPIIGKSFVFIVSGTFVMIQAQMLPCVNQPSFPFYIWS